MLIPKSKYFAFFFLFRCVLFSHNANGQVKTFEATYGSMANDLGSFVQQTADGGYILCGSKGVPGTLGYYDYALIKINPAGGVQWSTSFGDSLDDEQAQCVRQLADGSYIVFGSRSGSAASSAWMVKTDENGSRQWSAQQQGSDSARYGYAVVVAPDGGYQTASYDDGASNTDHFQLQKTDASGNIEWGPKNVVSGVGSSSSLALTRDGNYIAVGTSDVEFDSPTQNYYSMITLVKTNINGAVLWSKSFKINTGTNTDNYLQGFGVQATNDGGYIVCGSTNVNTHGSTDIFLLKTDANGDSLWSRNYGGSSNDVAMSVKEVPGGGYVMTGNTKSFGAGSGDIFILRTDATGDSLWMRMFGGTGLETAGNIEVTNDSGFVVIGTTNSYGAGQNDILILRTDSQGRIPDATVNSSNINTNMCNGNSVTLTAAAGYTYLWSNNATAQSITVNQAGNYTVTVTDAYGNINVSKVIAVADDHAITSASFTATGSTAFCAGSSVTFVADSSEGYIYQWQANGSDINGAVERSYTATEDASYNVVISNACSSVQASPVATQVYPLPPMPTITEVGNNLVSSSSTNNQWYRNGAILYGFTNQTFTPTADGNYTVSVGDDNHCTSLSEPININTVGINEVSLSSSYTLYPNPATDAVYVNYNLASASDSYFVIFNAEGSVVYKEKIQSANGKIQIATAQLADGLYFSGIETKNGLTGRTVLAIVHR